MFSLFHHVFIDFSAAVSSIVKWSDASEIRAESADSTLNSVVSSVILPSFMQKMHDFASVVSGVVDCEIGS